jgi:hypothetical protein
MQEIPFSLPVSGVIRIEEGSITVTINKTETIVNFQPPKKPERISLGKGRTVFDIVLETALQEIRRTKENRFSAAQLYGVALERYPELKRNSWVGHVIASAPNHSSHQHFGAKRDYFRYLGNGTYSLKDTYLDKPYKNQSGQQKV